MNFCRHKTRIPGKIPDSEFIIEIGLTISTRKHGAILSLRYSLAGCRRCIMAWQFLRETVYSICPHLPYLPFEFFHRYTTITYGVACDSKFAVIETKHRVYPLCSFGIIL